MNISISVVNFANNYINLFVSFLVTSFLLAEIVRFFFFKLHILSCLYVLFIELFEELKNERLKILVLQSHLINIKLYSTQLDIINDFFVG